MNQMTAVLMEMSGWWVVAHHLKAEWSIARLECGAPCVIMNGGVLMQLLFVVNWDSQLKVQFCKYLVVQIPEDLDHMLLSPHNRCRGSVLWFTW